MTHECLFRNFFCQVLIIFGSWETNGNTDSFFMTAVAGFHALGSVGKSVTRGKARD